MVLKCDVESLEIDNEILVVPVNSVNDEIHGIIKVNKAGWEIIELLKENTTEEMIVSRLMEKYDDEENTMKTYVHEFIEQLNMHGLIKE